MRIVKRIGQGILAFFLCLLIIANFIVILLNNTILQKDYMLTKLEENDYYEKIATDLQNEFENYQYQSGLPAEVFENLYEEDMLQSDINSVLNSLYEGSEIVLDSEKVRAKLDSNIQAYLAANNVTLKAQEKQNIENFENIIVGVYEDKIQVAQNYVDDISKIIMQLQSVAKLATIIGFVGLVFVLLITLLAHLRNINGFMDTVGISLLSSGIILYLVKVVVNKNIDIQNIVLVEQGFSDLVKYIASDVLEQFSFYGILFIIVGLIGIIGSKSNMNDEVYGES